MKYFALLCLPAGLACAAEFSTGQAARLVIGQETFTRQRSGASQTLLGGVSGLAYSDGTLLVVDSNRLQASPLNHRVLIYRNLPQILKNPTAEIPNDGFRCAVCTGVADAVLGQPDFNKNELSLSQNGLRNPTAVATDGRYVAVADTDNNRVMIWNSIPDSNAKLADVVVGQPDFRSSLLNFGGTGNTPSDKGLRGPQGVWIQDGRLFVADTQNNRILIWNRIPTQNGQAADVVLGQAGFTSFVQPDLTQDAVDARPNNLLTPVSVTSDGRRLFVADLGHNRVLVWNSIPSSNQAPADFALGQPDVASSKDVPAQNANNSRFLCASNGKDTANNDTYPARCAATVDFPRFALSDGRRLFIADGGNDRILVYNSIPTFSGQRADVILGQSDEFSAVYNDLRQSSADSIRTPASLAIEGDNLFVSDPFNRRVLVFTAGENRVPQTGVRNAASREVYAIGTVTFSGNLKENDEATVKVKDREYKYKLVKDDSFRRIITELVSKINTANDPDVFASPNYNFNTIVLTSRIPGELGNNIEYTVAVSASAELTLTAGGARLGGGQDAAKIAPGTIVTVQGNNFTDQTVNAPADGPELPRSLGGVQVYMDGIPAPLLFVSPDQINAQVPFEVSDASSVSAYVRTTRRDGTVSISNAIAMPVIPQNPGIFAVAGTDPRPAVALHGSSHATGVISVDGTVKAGEVATIRIADEREYKYTVVAEDTLESIRNNLIELINQDPQVESWAAGQFTRIRIRARAEGPGGDGITYTATAGEGSSLILSAFTSALCCSNKKGSPITPENPAVPGEVIIVYGTGLGLVQPDSAKSAAQTGRRYDGPTDNQPNAPVDAIAGAKTANVLYAGYKVDEVGVYELHLQLNSDIPTNEQTQLTIAQDIYISNIVTFAVKNPNEEPQ